MTMKIADVLSQDSDMRTEADALDAQLQSLKQQEKMIKKRKAQLRIGSAIKRYNAIK